ncbi:hydroxymethylbilane synthase [Pseudactinotalea sp. HY160]|uniref:hydroxymethylbilane synthase n=1 Tax=Pseudactinotalea sp. HY160 TaxID=2654490 RepID=UPI00131095C9|nr:hydroxymethylbilane synthase [Pseudactinotalea sp. HY160]
MIRIGTRASALATAQSGTVVAALAAAGEPAELVPMVSAGDRTRASLASLGGTGIFATRLREALLAGECDALVHSLKDLPTAPHPGLAFAATPAREDPRDVLCGARLADLPRGARVGTGSPRRRARLLAARPDLDVVDIRGNVETRLARALGPGADLDAVVLAAAGLRRLGRTEVIDEYLDGPAAPGQGAIVVEVRAGDDALARRLRVLHDAPTWAATTAERSLLAALEAGCAAPVAALAGTGDGTGDPASPGNSDTTDTPDTPERAGTLGNPDLRLEAIAYAPDGSSLVTGTATGTAEGAGALGRGLAAELLAGGAAAWL